MNRTARHRIVWSAAAVAALAILPSAVRAATLHLESNGDGEFVLAARDAAIIDALNAVGEEAGFEVLADRGPRRPPVNLQIEDAPVEDVLRQLLRGRNYAVVYDDGDISRVILLEPSTPGASGRSPAPRPPARARRGGKAAPAPIVIRN